jgi:3'(2'), 5'-bisphosphate nucleotidase
MTYTDLIPELSEIARNAGAAIMEIYANCEGVEIIKKADNSPLTAADKASNAVICAGLEKLPLQYPIVSEENKMVPYDTRKNYDFYWLIDPLDGTKEFIKRNGEFTVNIALIQNGKVVLGVVYTPALDELFWAATGKGAFKTVGGTTSTIKAPRFKMQDKGIKVVCSRSHLNDETKAFIGQLKEPDLVSKGSSLKFLELATGKAHLYPRVAPTMEWDTAAAQIILEEAGGKVVQYGTDNPVVYNKENMLNPYFVAYADVVQ